MFKKIPMFGGLFEAKASSLRSALQELLISTVFSTMPIWFYPLLASSIFKNSADLGDNVLSSIGQGELFIYSSALVGPLIFAITKNYLTWGSEKSNPNNPKFGKLSFEFPSGIWFFLFSTIICIVSPLCFGLLRFNGMGLIQSQIDAGNMLWISGFFYVFALLTLYAVSVYKNELETFSSGRSRTDTTDFVNKWNTRND